jgi:hypothetical protein
LSVSTPEERGNAHDMVFEVSGTGAAPSERARIDSSGRLLVGTSTSLSGSNLQVSAGAQASASITSFQASSDLRLDRASAGTTAVVDGNLLGSVRFRGYDGSTYVSAASIAAFVDGTPGANDMPGRLVFSTTADGASSPTERMRISSIYVGRCNR